MEEDELNHLIEDEDYVEFNLTFIKQKRIFKPGDVIHIFPSIRGSGVSKMPLVCYKKPVMRVKVKIYDKEKRAYLCEIVDVFSKDKIGEDVYLEENKFYKVAENYDDDTLEWLRSILSRDNGGKNKDTMEENGKKNNQVKIEIPDGCVIDVDNSDFASGTIVFRDKAPKTPEEIFKILNRQNKTATSHIYGNLEDSLMVHILSQLFMVAEYLNEGWRPTPADLCNAIWRVDYNLIMHCPVAACGREFNLGIPYFRTQELAEKAIEIIGKDNIRIAFEEQGYKNR